MDTDGFCTQVWDRDPIAIAIKNKLVMFVGDFPLGQVTEIQERIQMAFNKTLCTLRLKDGHFRSGTGEYTPTPEYQMSTAFCTLRIWISIEARQ
jgi:hypothetical protein